MRPLKLLKIKLMMRAKKKITNFKSLKLKTSNPIRLLF